MLTVDHIRKDFPILSRKVNGKPYAYLDNAKGVFNGKIMVRKDSQKIDAFQSNNNLLLSKSATIDSKPQLEIYADDVKCSHGCTIGQLDEDALFYMRSRGITEQQARVILTVGFVQDVLDCILHEPTKVSLADSLKKEINHYVNR